MNILITGSAGFIGGRLKHVLADNNRVFGLIHDSRADGGGITGDILNFPRMLEIIVDREIDQIYHCAAKSVVRNCRLDPINCFATNVLGTVTVLEAARQSERVKGIMVMESDKAYGPGPTPYVESQALQPTGIYEASKACVSHVARSYHANFGLPVFTIRSANVYGPGDPNMSRLIPNTISRLLRDESPQITSGASRFMREWIYVDDWISCAMALMRKEPWGEAFNVSSGQSASVCDVVVLICRLMRVGYSVSEWDKPTSLLEIEQQTLSLDKLHKWLPDWTARPLREGLAATIASYTEGSK